MERPSSQSRKCNESDKSKSTNQLDFGWFTIPPNKNVDDQDRPPSEGQDNEVPQPNDDPMKPPSRADPNQPPSTTPSRSRFDRPPSGAREQPPSRAQNERPPSAACEQLSSRAQNERPLSTSHEQAPSGGQVEQSPSGATLQAAVGFPSTTAYEAEMAYHRINESRDCGHGEPTSRVSEEDNVVIDWPMFKVGPGQGRCNELNGGMKESANRTITPMPPLNLQGYGHTRPTYSTWSESWRRRHQQCINDIEAKRMIENTSNTDNNNSNNNNNNNNTNINDGVDGWSCTVNMEPGKPKRKTCNVEGKQRVAVALYKSIKDKVKRVWVNLLQNNRFILRSQAKYNRLD